MESNRAYLGAAILVALVVFSNLIIYGIVRGVARGRKHIDWMKITREAWSNPRRRENADIDELHRRLDELKNKAEED